MNWQTGICVWEIDLYIYFFLLKQTKSHMFMLCVMCLFVFFIYQVIYMYIIALNVNASWIFFKCFCFFPCFLFVIESMISNVAFTCTNLTESFLISQS